jgi:hypothetical protein
MERQTNGSMNGQTICKTDEPKDRQIYILTNRPMYGQLRWLYKQTDGVGWSFLTQIDY